MATVTKYIPQNCYVGTKTVGTDGHSVADWNRLESRTARRVCLFQTRCLGDLPLSGASVIFFLPAPLRLRSRQVMNACLVKRETGKHTVFEQVCVVSALERQIRLPNDRADIP